MGSLTPSAVREMQIQIPVRIHCTPIRTAYNKKTVITPSAGNFVEKSGHIQPLVVGM
jgi:hypothetical protein